MSSSSYTLGVDTSHTRGQLCLLKENSLLENIFWEKEGSHSEILNSYFENLLLDHQITVKEISKLYCTIGPGSFTGLRVGVNFCKTLSYSQDIEIIPVNTLVSLAYSCDQKAKKILSAIDAQKNSLFISTFSKDKIPLQENKVSEAINLQNVVNEEYVVSGSGIERYKELINVTLLSKLTLDSSLNFPDISKVILANEKKSFLNTCLWNQLNPFYIRLSSAEEKLQSN